MKKITIVFIIISLLMQSCQKKKALRVSEEKKCEALVIQREHLVDLLYSQDWKDVQFIDVRSPHKFAISHIPGAINMPLNHFFDKENWKKLDKDKVIIVYGNNASEAQIASLMAKHFNNANFYAALGGYDYINSKILKGTGFYSGLYNDEEPLVDFQQKINEIRSMSGGSQVAPKSKPVKTVQPVVKRKKKEVTGGCG